MAMDLSWEDRLSLGHALVQRIADDVGCRVLHIKGLAWDARLARPRFSSDIDVWVDPGKAEELAEGLAAVGCVARTGFESGSIFTHAATLFHPLWGWIDLHRTFPGIDADPAAAFEHIWLSRTPRVFAGLDAWVPSLTHQSTIIVLNAARDPERGPDDVRHLRKVLSTHEWAAVVQASVDLDAQIAFAAGLGEHALRRFAHDPQYRLWRALSQGENPSQLFAARLRAAPSTSARVRLIAAAARGNADHLHARLGRRPRPLDVISDRVARMAGGPLHLRPRVVVAGVVAGLAIGVMVGARGVQPIRGADMCSSRCHIGLPRAARAVQVRAMRVRAMRVRGMRVGDARRVYDALPRFASGSLRCRLH